MSCKIVARGCGDRGRRDGQRAGSPEIEIRGALLERVETVRGVRVEAVDCGDSTLTHSVPSHDGAACLCEPGYGRTGEGRCEVCLPGYFSPSLSTAPCEFCGAVGERMAQFAGLLSLRRNGGLRSTCQRQGPLPLLLNQSQGHQIRLIRHRAIPQTQGHILPGRLVFSRGSSQFGRLPTPLKDLPGKAITTSS